MVVFYCLLNLILRNDEMEVVESECETHEMKPNCLENEIERIIGCKIPWSTTSNYESKKGMSTKRGL